LKTAVPGNQRCANCPHYRKIDEQVCVQLPTYADNVALPAFARRCCCNRSISPARRAHSSKPAATGLLPWARHAGTRRQTDRRKDTVPFRRTCSSHYAAVPIKLDAEAITGLFMYLLRTSYICIHTYRQTLYKCYKTVINTDKHQGCSGAGTRRDGVPHIFSTGGTRPPLHHFFGLKFVQKLVHCYNLLLTETQCKIISVQQN